MAVLARLQPMPPTPVCVHVKLVYGLKGPDNLLDGHQPMKQKGMAYYLK